MEKLDKVIAGLVMCGSENYSCPGCPYEELEWCEDEMGKDALEVIRDLTEKLKQAKDGRLELARKYQALVAERDDLRKDIAVLTEDLTGAHDECHRLAKSLRVARLQREQAWEKLARITGEREAAWLDEAFELRTCYCPLCDKHFEVRSNDSMGDCPDCGHHVVLHRKEVADV